MKRSFTLMELIMVMLIIGILSSVGYTRYRRTAERARVAEAKSVLGEIRMAEEAMNVLRGTYITTIFNDPDSILIDTTIPQGACAATHYFRYNIEPGADEDSFTAKATRCIANGKEPQYPGAAYFIFTSETGVFTGDARYL
jgi:prepilin-type N-terminal cleavage/methylation domain-containing protein